MQQKIILKYIIYLILLIKINKDYKYNDLPIDCRSNNYLENYKVRLEIFLKFCIRNKYKKYRDI